MQAVIKQTSYISSSMEVTQGIKQDHLNHMEWEGKNVKVEAVRKDTSNLETP